MTDFHLLESSVLIQAALLPKVDKEPKFSSNKHLESFVDPEKFV